jgi:hypothetical protein
MEKSGSRAGLWLKAVGIVTLCGLAGGVLGMGLLALLIQRAADGGAILQWIIPGFSFLGIVLGAVIVQRKYGDQ